MDTYEGLSERAYLDHLSAREKALDAAVGHFAADNVPTLHLWLIAESSMDKIIALAARIVLHQRGEPDER